MKKFNILFLAMVFCCLLMGCEKKEASTCSHRFVTVVAKAASCQGTGIQKHTCQICGLTFEQVTPAAEHHYTETVTKEATCSEEGIRTQLCTSCGTTEEAPMPLADHAFDFYSLEPSRCTVCGESVPGAAADPTNPWYGKQWIALGTSLSSEAQGTYVAPLAERSGMTAVSLGVPGGTAVEQVLQTVQTADLSQADLITIEFGINDWAAHVPLGDNRELIPYLSSIDQWTNENKEDQTFAGACYQIFNTLQKRAPNAVIIYLTESTGQAAGQEDCSWNKTNHIDLLQRDYTETAMLIARYAGVHVIDAGNMSMINQYNPQYLADQVHHSELGGKQYALTVWMELKDMAPLLKSE